MNRIEIRTSKVNFPVAAYAVVGRDETPIDAVKRSIERTSGGWLGLRLDSYTQDRQGRTNGETHRATLAERKQAPGGGYGVIAEFFIYI